VTHTFSTDYFVVDRNLYLPGADPMTMKARYSKFPGRYGLRIYNSAGELVRVVVEKRLSQRVDETYTWDGRNDAGDPCASGVYIAVLMAPYDTYYDKFLLAR